MELGDLDEGLKAVASGGHVLSCQEVVGVQASLMLLQRQQKHASIYLWGKIYGQSGDYFIAYGLSEAETELPAKTYYWAGEDFEFSALPRLTEETATKLAVMGLDGKPLMGQPQAPIYAATDAATGGEATPSGLVDLDRLSQVVQEIDFDTAVVPFGAHVLNETRTIVRSSDFVGLAAEEATDLSKYMHFRTPADIGALRAHARSDTEFYANFLDRLDDDLPKGCWGVRQDLSANLVTLRSLSWPGYIAYHVPRTTNFGGMYFGYAKKNRDLPFML